MADQGYRPVGVTFQDRGDHGTMLLVDLTMVVHRNDELPITLRMLHQCVVESQHPLRAARRDQYGMERSMLLCVHRVDYRRIINSTIGNLHESMQSSNDLCFPLFISMRDGVTNG